MAKFLGRKSVPLFKVERSTDEAQALVSNYTTEPNIPANVNSTILSPPTRFYEIALEVDDHTIVKVINPDDCFCLYLKLTNLARLSTVLLQAVSNILGPFPRGLSISVGLLVATPVYSEGSVNITNFPASSCHGLVV